MPGCIAAHSRDAQVGGSCRLPFIFLLGAAHDFDELIDRVGASAALQLRPTARASPPAAAISLRSAF